MDDANEDIEIQAAKLRADNALGRSPVLYKLFDFLVARSRSPGSPKEVEIAGEVFGRSVDFDVGQDASVRVYVHRLRRKLDEYYSGPGAAEELRLTIPKGEYRIVLASHAAGERTAEGAPPSRFPTLSPRAWIGIAAAVVLVNLIGWGAILWGQASHDSWRFARGNPAWQGLFENQRPVTIVVGDYYIFAETDGAAGVNRLVREFDINSPGDLADHLMMHPELMGRYSDVDLHYLPVASAFALDDIMPLLSSGSRSGRQVRVVLASDLTPDMLKQSNIIYIGYLSGLGILRGPVFAGSRFQIGESYDELVDRVSHKSYVSQEGMPDDGGQTKRDYGYFASFAGPEGNRIIIIAGTRDTAVMQTAEAVTNRPSLATLTRSTPRNGSFEALYEVEGIRRINLGGRLVTAGPLKVDKIWSPEASAVHFPAG